MNGIIVAFRSQAHPQAKLLNIDTNVHSVRVHGCLIQLTDGCPTVHTQMEADRTFILVIQKSFVLMQIFTAKLPAAVSADIGLLVCRR